MNESLPHRRAAGGSERLLGVPKVTQKGEKATVLPNCPLSPCHVTAPPAWAHTFADDSVTVGDDALMGNQHILDLGQEHRVQIPQLDGLCPKQRDTGAVPAV